MRATQSAAAVRSLDLRIVRFEDVPEVLRMIRRSVEGGCRHHYDSVQRGAVFASYAAALFMETLGPFVTVVAEQDGQIVGVAQLDPGDARLRALFVDSHLHQRGLGRALLDEIEARAVARGCARLHGAMSLNAVPFYLRAGFHRSDGAERLVSAAVWVPVVRMEKNLVAGANVAARSY